MAHIAIPHWLAEYGLAVGLLGVACAVYLQIIWDRPVPARYPLGLGLSGAALVIVHAPVIQGLPPRAIVRLHGVLVIAAAVLYIAGTGWILANVDPVTEAADVDVDETLPAEDLDMILEYVADRVGKRLP